MGVRTKIQAMANFLIGTSESVERALEAVGIDNDIDGYEIDIIEDMLLDENCERCGGCDWWFESGELVDSAGDYAGYCDDCRGTPTDPWEGVDEMPAVKRSLSVAEIINGR